MPKSNFRKIISQQNANDALLQALLDWERVSNYMKIAKTYNLSRPFVCSLSPEYCTADKKVMIIGQETRDWPPYNSPWTEQAIQNWTEEYLRKQLWNIGSPGVSYNRSAFWRFFRKIKDMGYVPCWNNVDKAHQIVNGKTVPLSCAIQKMFSGKKVYTQTLLLEENKICQPDCVIFITGPNYSYTMSESLCINEATLLLNKPASSKPLTDITSIAKLGVPTYWTYHPTYLSKCGEFKKVIGQLGKLLP